MNTNMENHVHIRSNFRLSNLFMNIQNIFRLFVSYSFIFVNPDISYSDMRITSAYSSEGLTNDEKVECGSVTLLSLVLSIRVTL
jgi:hypothetical protein